MELASNTNKLSSGELSLISFTSFEYQSAKSEPYHPSWGVFIRETLAQFHKLVFQGWEFELSPENPYSSSDHMFMDARVKFLRVYQGGRLSILHPLRGTALYKGNRWTVNEMFRVVHDVNGHFRARAPFETLKGELAAYCEHKRIYSEGSLPALYSETVGQLCYYYANGEFVNVQTPKIIPVRYDCDHGAL